MKYWLITRTSQANLYLYEIAESEDELRGDKFGYSGNDFVFTEISSEEFNLQKTYHYKLAKEQPINPSTGQPWTSGFDPERIKYAENKTWEKEIQSKAYKGQEVQNAIELNEAFRSYVQVMIYNVDFLIKGNQKDMILHPNDSIHVVNEEKHMKEYKAYINLYRSIVTFERHIAIATNIDPKHPVSFPNRQSMENVISHIKANEPELWTDIAKMLKVEEAYEPKEAVDAWIAIEKAANPHINVQPTTDTGTQIVDSVVSGGT